MKILRFLLPILILIIALFLVPACGGYDTANETKPAIETAEGASGETKSEITGEENAEIGSAIASGNLENFKNLIVGFDINARDENGKTMLMRAVSSHHTDIVDYLIENDADVNARDYEATTVLMYAVKNASPYFSELLIKSGADINAKDIEGFTPLMIAVSFNKSEGTFLIDESVYDAYVDTAKLLIESGAEPNILNRRGRSALSIAKDFGLNGIVEMLREIGGLESNMVKGDYNDELFETLAELCWYASLDEVIRFIGEKEIDINDDYGIALLIDASLNCRKDIVEYLLDNGADPNYKDYYDVTVLMYAEGNNCIEVVELLLNNGADLDIVAYDGRTVLDSARDNGHTEIIELLEAAGAE